MVKRDRNEINNVQKKFKKLKISDVNKISLIDKYEPKKLKEMLGNGNQLYNGKEWLKNWEKEKFKCLYITGDVGCGKTLLAKLLSKRYGYEIYHVSANQKNFSEIYNIATTSSVFIKSLILLDDIEVLIKLLGASFQKILFKVLDCNKIPVILTGKDKYDKTLNKIKKLCKMIKLDKPTAKSLYSYLNNNKLLMNAK